MRLIYNIGIYIYLILLRIVSPFNRKAKLWVSGRKGWYQGLKGKIDPAERYIWVHCASLGEFEQGRPVIEAIKKKDPGCRIILTFFSPSGYEIRKNYGQADIIYYLPADNRRNAERFISLVNPEKVIFVKYEFWYNYISVLDERAIPLYIISAIFRQDQYFFRWYGMFFRKLLHKIKGFYVQDQLSADVLRAEGLGNVIIAGDTRFDRVIELAENARNIDEIELFRGSEKLVVAGSTWEGDEKIIARFINRFPDRIKWVIAPHEIEKGNIERLEKLLEVRSLRFSRFRAEECDARVLIIDNIGMLSSVYRYAHVAVIGGGFGRGIHNLLEAACWGVPVLFGPNHKKFREALELKENGGGKSFTNYTEFEELLNELMYEQAVCKKASEAACNYVKENAGATHKIIAGII
ncbi:MAG TPA: glycosyltransferase N-terminal domain-containing protein [Bacteroidales bacterium]|nr:glycosyltransferase N-terminal domain-containing protein [Bacteroidales bacterium]HQK68123.1 glycosyltransferase N-terminal domain-containing protein [Bacteroidales bacterium]